MNAIETSYRGHLFRSRLEARWAAFFDLIGWEWTYEPFDLSGYIPDFLIRGNRDFLVEVKPATNVAQLRTMAGEKARSAVNEWDGELVVVGADIAMRVPDAHRNYDFDVVALGVNYARCGDDVFDDYAIWTRCRWNGCRCNRFGWGEHEMSYVNRPCGGYDGNLECIERSDEAELRLSWGEAHRLTRWAPSAI